MITDNWDEFKTSVKCGILPIFVIRAVAAEVAIND